MLTAALRLDPDYETAWIWFASIAHDDAERRYCYERAMEINPSSVVADRLARMRTTVSTPPSELADMEAPPLPEEFGGEHLAQRANGVPGFRWHSERPSCSVLWWRESGSSGRVVKAAGSQSTSRLLRD